MRTRKLHLLKLGKEVEVTDLSSDSEDEASVRSPAHNPPTPAAASRGNCLGTGGRGTDGASEPQGGAATSQRFRDAVTKGKEKVVEGESAWAAGPPRLDGRVLPDARGSAMEIDGDPWSADAGEAGGGGNNGAGSWGDQKQKQSERRGFEGRNGQQGRIHNVWDDPWPGILGSSPSSASTPWRPWDTGLREHEAGISVQGRSQPTGEVSGYDDILMEDSSSSWLSRVKGLNFPLPDEHQLRARQVELDEEFARELQGQFNKGLPGSQHSEEADTAIAWTLQQEDVQRARTATREGQSSSFQSQRDRSMAHLYSYGPHSPAQNSASWAHRNSFPMSSRRGFGRISESPEVQQQNMLISQLTRGCFTDDMDLETRLAVLESFHDAFQEIGDPYSQDSDDEYENLLALDANNHHRGASDDQINNLPMSTVQDENLDDPCAVCLDCPAAGDSLRHLPCFHKFHKDCIDRWLRMKTSCPVCKTTIV